MYTEKIEFSRELSRLSVPNVITYVYRNKELGVTFERQIKLTELNVVEFMDYKIKLMELMTSIWDKANPGGYVEVTAQQGIPKKGGDIRAGMQPPKHNDTVPSEDCMAKLVERATGKLIDQANISGISVKQSLKEMFMLDWTEKQLVAHGYLVGAGQKINSAPTGPAVAIGELS